MELAKNLAQWQQMTPDQWLAQANRLLPPVVVVLLVILIAARAADLTWALLASPVDQDAVPAAPRIGPGNAAGRGAATVSYAALADWRPFGEPPVEDPNQPAGIPFPDDAPETTLDLVLRGVIEVTEPPEPGALFIPEEGSAIIANGRQPGKFYRTGETIENASGAKLFAVFAHHVMLDRSGRIERLSFPPIDAAVRSGARLNSNIAAAPSPTARQPAPTPVPVTLSEDLAQVAATLSQHLTIAPQREGNRQIGFRLQPQGNGQAFQALGLEPGDVLTEVNGTRLDNVNNTISVLQALVESPRADVVIRRNGFDQTMSLDIGQLQRIAESVQ